MLAFECVQLQCMHITVVCCDFRRDSKASNCLPEANNLNATTALQNSWGGASKDVIDMSTSSTRKDAKADAAQDSRCASNRVNTAPAKRFEDRAMCLPCAYSAPSLAI